MRLIICTTDQLKDMQGWHLIQPDSFSLKFGITTAEERGHDTCYVHYERIGTACLRVPYDAIQTLLMLSLNHEIGFTHPCTADNSPQSEYDLRGGK